MKKMIFNSLFLIILPSISFGAVEMYVDSVHHVGIEQVVVKGRCLDVNITGVSSDMLIMKGAHLSDRVVVKSHRSGKVLEVWVELINFPFAFGCTGELLFTVPSSASVEVKTTTGHIAVKNMKKTMLDIKSASGSIELQNCRGDITAIAASGAIMATKCHGPKQLKSASGFLQVEHSRGPVTVATISGAQNFENITGNLDAESVSGSLTMQQVKGVLKCETVSGAIHGDEISVLEHSEFESTSGAINIDFLNPLSDFAFNLESVSGTLSAGNTTGKKAVVTGDGEISITGETISGSQVYK